MKKLMKYTKKIKISPNLSKEFQIMWDDFKKMRQKTKKNNSPSAFPDTRGRDPSPSAGGGTRGRGMLPRLLR
jgi:hypothetical protein